MKFIHCIFAFVLVFLGGCSSHLYRIDANRVTLSLKHRTAQTLFFVCSLDGFQARRLKKNDGVWAIDLPANKPFTYFYIVNDEIFIPACAVKEKDDFGSMNCIFVPEL
ncbi:MAG: hypothetical protein WBB19_10080 [Desulforhopalus sp.]